MSEEHRDILTPALAARHAAVMDRAGEPRQAGPQGIHWCLTLPETQTGDLGPDGHPPHGDDPALPRRMWASSEIQFHAPIAIGAAIRRRTEIAERREKTGKSGRLLFVTLAHSISAGETLAVTERQSIVYREAAPFGSPPPPPGPPLEERAWDWERIVTPDAVLLFRFSALTFNSHRIHYDLPYATHQEGYPGLVVHGPLIASLLLDLADRHLGPGALARFSFRAVSPAFAGRRLRVLAAVHAGNVEFAVADANGHLVMSAQGSIRNDVR